VDLPLRLPRLVPHRASPSGRFWKRRRNTLTLEEGARSHGGSGDA
jgi:hypothetical protein